MRVSVALCTYNGASHLPQQLESLAQQEHLPYEVIACDDQSTDETLSILKAFSRSAPFAVHIEVNKERLGSTRNFEKAISACTGDAIALCDQDDIWYPQKLTRLVEALQHPSVGGAFSDGDLLYSDSDSTGSLWSAFGIDSAEYEELSRGDAVGVLLRSNKVTGMTLMFRRELLSEILPIPPHWVHDYWIALLLVILSRLEPVAEHLVAYRSHTGQQLGVPASFGAMVRRDGLKSALAELSRVARRESGTLAEQMGSLTERLEREKTSPQTFSVLSRLRNRTRFLAHRSRVQDTHILNRLRTILANGRLYNEFSPRPMRDRIIDLLAVQPAS